jgi:DNA helicase II / ATP-dependent DNA helicase PcrA
LKPKPRGALRGLLDSIDRWRAQREALPHTELAEIILDESGYTEMWQKDRSADAAGRLENLKELIRSMDEFENLQGFLEHISLVMDNEKAAEADAVNIMTLHSAKGLEFDTVFLPGWEEGVFPNQRTLDDQGRAGLEEERRLAHVGLTRARKRAKIYFATNRRMHGLWQTNIPSRFLDELPEAHVEVTESQAGFGGYGGYGASRFDAATSFGSNYRTPGWQRAQGRRTDRGGGFEDADAADYAADHTPNGGDNADDRTSYLSRATPDPVRGREGEGVRTSRQHTPRRLPLTIEGELIAKSTGTTSAFALGDRVFHQKFGNGNITAIDGNKLTIQFDKAGQKRVVDSFVERV